MIDRWHDPWVFFWIVFLYIVIHVAYGLWREKTRVLYHTTPQIRTPKISLIWTDRDKYQKHNNKWKKNEVLVILFV